MNKSRENEKEISNLIADILPIKLTNVQMVKGVLWLYGKNIKKNGEFAKIYKKWFGKEPPEEIVK